MSSDKPIIKLFVSCHKDGVYFPDNPLVLPVQVGAADAPSRFDDMFHDDEGDNISQKNPYYCELTAQYWAWKNQDADYYGFMHYRRYFSFSDEVFDTNYFGDALVRMNDEATLRTMGYDEQTMRSRIEPYDLIVPQRGAFVAGETLRKQYEESREQHSADLDCVLDIIRERHPEFLDAANSYLDGTEGYFCNMFIMRKELFQNYCEWLFDILAEHERRRDFSQYDVVSYRVSGYLAERLCGIYLTWLISQGYSYTTLQRVLFEDVDATPILAPAFGKKADVALVFSANQWYVPYLSTILQSVVDHASEGRRYDIIVLNQDIEAADQSILVEQLVSDDVSLRFLDVNRAMEDYQDKLFMRGHFKVETYFRLLLPDLLPDYHKVLYLDADMVVRDDVAKLYDTDVDGRLVAACKDPDTAGLYNGAADHKKAYMDDVLKIRKPFEYFQAGTVIFNLDEWRRIFTTEEIFTFAQSNDWELLDQDVLNYLCQGRTAFLDMRWNVMIDWRGMRIERIIKRAPRQLYYAYMEARKNPAIVHFAGPDKPWDNPSSDMARYFWEVARRTPYYEVLIARLIDDHMNPPKKPAVTRAKEYVYKKVLVPVARTIYPNPDKGLEHLRYVYRTIRPVKNDIF